VTTTHAANAGHAVGAVVIGTDGYLIHADATVIPGSPGLRIIGLPGAVAWTARARVRAALANSGQPQLPATIAVTIRAENQAWHGAHADLAIAVAALIAGGIVPASAAEGTVLVAELGLDGRLRPAREIGPILRAAAATGYRRRVVIAAGSTSLTRPEAGLTVAPCASLNDALSWLAAHPLPAPSQLA
jgi:magnesium chelatase family protein